MKAEATSKFAHRIIFLLIFLQMAIRPAKLCPLKQLWNVWKVITAYHNIKL